ncbi:NADH dehydrogenase (ubiquinone) complex I, assembly factor 6-like isoform X2 [Xenia sp. Carnegie-2017]|uniref:NADH dehydrogenase (ubiquinone) complex I, assembly factor 6-like isoform X2 n=1 Tax=Xenia sp. Carnegie-2017 TaxID=2897299 RepID=UPI001F04DC22|nr:NADH dehydrogenase (ubiquinone) complex I, assembly factor 6-like isoform X2 [Xenia sp. Carnegie-2017]
MAFVLKHSNFRSLSKARTVVQRQIVKKSSIYERRDATAINYCVNLVRHHDYENYLCCLLVKKQSRNAIFAIRALNVELAKISDSTTVETIGKMKLKFWRDTVQSIYTKAIELYGLSKHWISRILDSREENLHSNPFTNMEELEAYSERSVSSILYLSLEASGVKDANADHCASHLGKAMGIITLLRSTLHHLKSRKVLWPNDIMIKNGISQEDMLRGRNLPAIKEATYEIACRAHAHLDKAKTLGKNIPKLGSRCLLPIVPFNTFLENLRQMDFDIFDSKLYQRNGILPVLLLKVLLMGSFGR